MHLSRPMRLDAANALGAKFPNATTRAAMTATGNRKLRVAMIAFSPNHHTTRWARALTDAGLDVHVVGVSTEDPQGLLRHHAAGRRLQRGIPILSAAAEWHDAVAAIRPDVVYIQWLFARPAMLLALEPKWPVVATVMGSDVEQDEALNESMLERVWRTALLLRARYITTAAVPLARVVQQYHPELLDRIRIVPFGVDTAQFHPPRVPRRRQVGQPLVIGHFKSDDVTYGRLDLLRAVQALLAEGAAVQLHLAGRRGNDGGAVTAYLAAHPAVAARVIDHGLCEVEAMPRLYQGLDVYVMNSLQESFGVAAAEALASGVPVIASDVGGVRCLVRPGDTGLLVPPADVPALTTALREIAGFPAFAQSAADRGRAHVCAKYEWLSVVQRMAALIRDAAGEATLAAVAC